MLSATQKLANSVVIETHQDLCEHRFISEATDVYAAHPWPSYCREKAKHVRVPIIYTIDSADAMVEGSPEDLEVFIAAFEKAPKRESLV